MAQFKRDPDITSLSSLTVPQGTVEEEALRILKMLPWPIFYLYRRNKGGILGYKSIFIYFTNWLDF
jgi:hypothetical protein